MILYQSHYLIGSIRALSTTSEGADDHSEEPNQEEKLPTVLEHPEETDCETAVLERPEIAGDIA